MEKGNFKTRYKLKVIVDGKVDRIIKSYDLGYIFSQKKKIRKDYHPSGVSDGVGKGGFYKDPIHPVVSFNIVSSNVIKTAKPRYKEFKNLPENTVHYGINSDGQYYAATENYEKVVLLKEI